MCDADWLGETQARGEASKLEGKGGWRCDDVWSLMLVAGLWASACGAQSAPPANSQDNPAPCPVAPQPVPCGATPGKPDAAQKFPFPGETDAAAPSLSGVPQTGVPDAPGAAGSPTSPAAAAKVAEGLSISRRRRCERQFGRKQLEQQFQFQQQLKFSSDASPTDASSGANPALKDQGSEGAPPGRHLLHRVNPVGTKLQMTDEREAEDLDIAHYYTQTGDLQGAYLRSQDAVKMAPDDAEAHFALAETAAKLNKRDEAIAEYNACLKLDPMEKEAKAARKALERLKP